MIGALASAEPMLIERISGLHLDDRYTRIDTPELDTASAVITRLQGPFHAHQFGSKAGGAVRIRAALCGSVAVSTFSFGRSVKIVPDGIGDALLVTTAIHGKAEIANRGRVMQVGVGESFISHGEDMPTFVYAPDTELLKIRFERRRLEELCARIYGSDKGTRLSFQTEMPAPGAARWLSLLRYLLVSLNGAGGIAMSTYEISSIEEHLMLALLNIQPHNQVVQSLDSRHDITARQFSAASNFIDRYLASELTLASIADAAHCSMRSLSRVFASVGEVSPMQYVRRLRMKRVRADLCSDLEARKTISEIAFQWGYNHLGEFNRQYRQTFGETPSTTRQCVLAENRLASGQFASDAGVVQA